MQYSQENLLMLKTSKKFSLSFCVFCKCSAEASTAFLSSWLIVMSTERDFCASMEKDVDNSAAPESKGQSSSASASGTEKTSAREQSTAQPRRRVCPCGQVRSSSSLGAELTISYFVVSLPSDSRRCSHWSACKPESEALADDFLAAQMR